MDEQGETSTSAEVRALLEETVAQHVDPVARIEAVRELPVSAGMSGAEVKRYELRLRGARGQETRVRLVTKEASLGERLTLAHLGEQRLSGVPFNHTLDLQTDTVALVCMQDIGSTTRPTSLEAVSEEVVRREAAALAGIHAANRGLDGGWLPRADRAYYAGMIRDVAWQPHWVEAISDVRFRAEFGDYIDSVEGAAKTIVDEMAALSVVEGVFTLVHTDINPSNVLLLDGVPYIIDWQPAHYGPFYLDVPHHFFTPELAEQYRVALAEQGVTVTKAEFMSRFRIAARYTALRYMWWTLEAWREDPREKAWVLHYFGMIRGEDGR